MLTPMMYFDFELLIIKTDRLGKLTVKDATLCKSTVALSGVVHLCLFKTPYTVKDCIDEFKMKWPSPVQASPLSPEKVVPLGKLPHAKKLDKVEADVLEYTQFFEHKSKSICSCSKKTVYQEILFDFETKDVIDGVKKKTQVYAIGWLRLRSVYNDDAPPYDKEATLAALNVPRFDTNSFHFIWDPSMSGEGMGEFIDRLITVALQSARDAKVKSVHQYLFAHNGFSYDHSLLYTSPEFFKRHFHIVNYIGELNRAKQITAMKYVHLNADGSFDNVKYTAKNAVFTLFWHFKDTTSYQKKSLYAMGKEAGCPINLRKSSYDYDIPIEELHLHYEDTLHYMRGKSFL